MSSEYCTVTMILSIVKLNFNKMQREETIKSKIMELSVDQSVRLCKTGREIILLNKVEVTAM
jgi:hypothetical protein